MSLLCGNCRKDMEGGYNMLYLLETIGNKLTFANGGDYVSPNCAICTPCAGNALQVGFKEVGKVTAGYALVPASSGGGRALWSDIETDDSKAVYFEKDLARRKWKSAMEIIDGMARSSQKPTFTASDPDFFERLVSYLKACDFKVVEMSEIAPHAIVVKDNFGMGELDLYFDSQAVDSKSEAMPMSFMTNKPGFDTLRLGVLEGVSFGCPPSNSYEFLQLAPEIVVPKRESWHESPKPVLVPEELQA